MGAQSKIMKFQSGSLQAMKADHGYTVFSLRISDAETGWWKAQHFKQPGGFDSQLMRLSGENYTS